MAGLYDQDFYAWTQEQAALLKEGRLSVLDVDHLAEELEGMGRSERRELVNRLAVLLAHLLKWQYQPVRRGRSWRATITEQRYRVQERLEESPSLHHDMDDSMARAYRYAVLQAIRETGLAEDSFSDRCPYTLAQALDHDFWPD